jgi:hypothetical protein
VKVRVADRAEAALRGYRFPLTRDERLELVEALLDEGRLVNYGRTIHELRKVNAARIIGQTLTRPKRPMLRAGLTNAAHSPQGRIAKPRLTKQARWR